MFLPIWGIVVGIVIEAAAIALVYVMTVVSPPFGALDYYLASTLVVMFGAAFAYWQYLEIQTTIRESSIYRGVENLGRELRNQGIVWR